jgi:hypothetical protein
MKEKAYEAIREAWYSPHIQYIAAEAVKKWPDKLRECIRQGGLNNLKG